MTPLAGTWLGYSLLVIALILAIYFFYPWNRTGSSAKESIATGPSVMTSYGVRVAVLVPSILLAVMAGVWSYFGGLPALLTNEPATYVELTDAITFPELFKPSDTTKINVYFANKGPLPAKDITFGFVLAIRHSFITKPQEDEMFNEILKNHKPSPKMDMGVGNSGFRTIETKMLSKKEADDLQSESTRLYLVGFIHYLDKNGQQTHEVCRWLQPPQQGASSVWHLCDGGHNRMVSGDTPY